MQVQARIESSHGIGVVTRDIQDPLTGDLDGAEERLFLLGHLFGHMVQWNVALDAGAEANSAAVLKLSRCRFLRLLRWPGSSAKTA